jgi:mRNA interferase MazF
MVLSRIEVLEYLNELIVVPITRTIRGLATEVVLTQDDGMPVTCALNFDHIALAQKDRMGSALGTLGEARWPEVRTALLTACGFESGEAS